MAGVVDAVEELWTEIPPGSDATDILCFFSGEREIRDAADALTALKLPGTEVLPLYARLSAAEQHRVFRRSGQRRIILATNVAETSLTVPGIGFVVDTGTARISRYSQRTRCNGCRSSRSARRALPSALVDAGGWPRASASGSTPRRTSRPAPTSPSPRCSAPPGLRHPADDGPGTR